MTPIETRFAFGAGVTAGIGLTLFCAAVFALLYADMPTATLVGLLTVGSIRVAIRLVNLAGRS